MANPKRQNIIGRSTPYDRTISKVFPGTLSTTLNVQNEFQNVDIDSIKIATEFPSDYAQWSYVGSSRKGDFLPTNLGNAYDTQTYSKAYRFESATAQSSHVIRSKVYDQYQNGYYPNLIFIGNHNLQEGDYIKFKAYSDENFTIKGYEIRINYSPKDTVQLNTYSFSKYKYYELEFVLTSSRVLSVGRIILASTLPTKSENNAQEEITIGFKDYREEVITESMTRIFNRKFWGKILQFSMRINLSDSFKLSDQIQTLITKGTGSQPLLVVINPKDPNFRSIYGILNEAPDFQQTANGYGIYSMSLAEFM